jgi:catalase
MPVVDNQNQLKAGPRGRVLLEDHAYRERINHFE